MAAVCVRQDALSLSSCMSPWRRGAAALCRARQEGFETTAAGHGALVMATRGWRQVLHFYEARATLLSRLAVCAAVDYRRLPRHLAELQWAAAEGLKGGVGEVRRSRLGRGHGDKGRVEPHCVGGRCGDLHGAGLSLDRGLEVKFHGF